MSQRFLLGWAMVAVLVVATLPHAHAAPDAGTRCRTTKIAATGAHAQETLRCHTRAIGRGVQVAPSCLAAADAKLARGFTRAEKKTVCPPSLAAAQAESAAFVVALLAAAAPTPVVTPSPTPTPTPHSTGCGNGIVEGAERCDGQPFCNASCQLRSPTVCCGQSGACIEGEFPVMADQCFLSGIAYTLGSVCQLADPECDGSGAPCAGSCVPEATFAPLELCCEMAAGCAEQSVSSTVEVYQFTFQGCLLGVGSEVVVGTCGPSGNCVRGN
jgi:hypothetical protein